MTTTISDLRELHGSRVRATVRTITWENVKAKIDEWESHVFEGELRVVEVEESELAGWYVAEVVDDAGKHNLVGVTPRDDQDLMIEVEAL